VSARKLVHVILDNYAVRKHPKVRQWLARHPRFAFHFAPTAAVTEMQSVSWHLADGWENRQLALRNGAQANYLLSY
jgi:hypothetical protein